jgi:hypothetical protein
MWACQSKKKCGSECLNLPLKEQLLILKQNCLTVQCWRVRDLEWAKQDEETNYTSQTTYHRIRPACCCAILAIKSINFHRYVSNSKQWGTLIWRQKNYWGIHDEVIQSNSGISARLKKASWNKYIPLLEFPTIHCNEYHLKVRLKKSRNYAYLIKTTKAWIWPRCQLEIWWKLGLSTMIPADWQPINGTGWRDPKGTDRLGKGWKSNNWTRSNMEAFEPGRNAIANVVNRTCEISSLLKYFVNMSALEPNPLEICLYLIWT